MRYLQTLAISGALLCGMTSTAFAEAIVDRSQGVQPAPRADTIPYDEWIAVEEPLSAEELALAQQAALRLATVNEAGELILPRIKTTRTVQLPKALYYAPPAQVLTDAKRFIHYFCECWKAEDFERMYYAMSPEYRATVPYATFAGRFADDKSFTGGLDDESIRGEPEKVPQGLGLQVTLTFLRKTVPARTITTLVTQTPDGYRIVESGLIPQIY